MSNEGVSLPIGGMNEMGWPLESEGSNYGKIYTLAYEGWPHYFISPNLLSHIFILIEMVQCTYGPRIFLVCMLGGT